MKAESLIVKSLISIVPLASLMVLAVKSALIEPLNDASPHWSDNCRALGLSFAKLPIILMTVGFVS